MSKTRSGVMGRSLLVICVLLMAAVAPVAPRSPSPFAAGWYWLLKSLFDILLKASSAFPTQCVMTLGVELGSPGLQ